MLSEGVISQKLHVYRIFEELPNLYLITLLISFFPLLLWITAKKKNQAKKISYLNYKIRLSTILQIKKLQLTIHLQ